jgi:hypothetical protein
MREAIKEIGFLEFMGIGFLFLCLGVLFLNKVNFKRKFGKTNKVRLRKNGAEINTRKTYPNDKCFCGSGKKYKHCHTGKEYYGR